MAKKQKKPRSHVKRLKQYQKQKQMSPAAYKKKLRIARRKDFFRWFRVAILILAALVVVAFFGANYLMYRRSGETLRSCAREAKELVEASVPEDFMYAEPSQIFSADGTRMAELSEDTDATFLPYEEIPIYVVNAFVAVEDRSFWTNSGVDYKGMIRVVFHYVRSRGSDVAGASTITQQLARGIYLSNEQTMVRKIQEIFIARELTKKYTKEEIITFYCNTCCFANGIYGVEDASEKYFGRSVNELTLSEIAYLCAIPNRPEYYNPLKEPENAISRRDKILGDMAECGYITEATCLEAQAQTIAVADVQEETAFYNYEVTYAIHCAVRYLMKLDGFQFQYEFVSEEAYSSYMDTYEEYYAQARHKLYTGGYEVYTTIDLTTQAVMQGVLDEQLAFSDTLTEEGIYELQGALTVIDNDTGKVVAIIGGRSQEDSGNIYSLNRAYQGYAQPGSALKPLAVYAPALCNGYSSSSMLRDIDVEQAKTGTAESIAAMSGKEVSLRTAVEQSTNGCAYWLFNEITPRVGLSYVTSMEFSRITASDYTLSAALGGLTHGVNTVEMANAYFTLENHGEYTETDCLLSLYDNSGTDLYKNPESKTVYSREAADEMTDILQGVFTSGTASKAAWSSLCSTEAAGKTGTTNDNKAGWFCGYTPYYTIAVWVGCDTPKSISDLQGSSYPLSIWEEAMLFLTGGLPARSFDLSYDESQETSSAESYNRVEDVTDEVAEEEEPEEPEPTEDISGETIITPEIEETDRENSEADTGNTEEEIPPGQGEAAAEDNTAGDENTTAEENTTGNANGAAEEDTAAEESPAEGGEAEGGM